VKNVNYNKNFLEIGNGKHIHFEKLLVASGGTPRVPKVTGATTLHNVHVLRNWSDLQSLK
jgi:NADPH-dependent 2,4-dienoyl-CoA reductase/sulfur reductase-like enzyme